MSSSTTERQRRDRWQDGFGRTATRSLQTLLILALVVIVAYVLITLRLVVVPLLVSLLLAAALAPVVDLLHRVGLPRGIAVAVTLLTVLGLLGGVFWLVGDAVAGQFSQLRQGVTEGITQLQTFVTEGPFNVSQQQVDDAITQLQQAAQGAQVRSGAITGATLLAQILTGVVLALVLLFFLLKDARVMWDFAKEQVPQRVHHRMDAVGERSVHVLGGYVRGTATVALVDAVLIGIGLVVLGVPLAFPLALITFVGAFIPIIGAVLAGVFAALITLVSNGPVDALIVVGIVVLVNQLEGNVLAPFLLGQAISLHPLAVLLALTAGTIVAGIIGAILAVPFAAVAWGAVSAIRADNAKEEAIRRQHEERERLGIDGPHGATVLDKAAAPGTPSDLDRDRRDGPADEA